MPPKRAADSNPATELRPKRMRKPTQRAIERDGTPPGTASQPIQLPDTQLSASPPPPEPAADAVVTVEEAADG